MPKTHAEWETHKDEYLGKIETQLTTYPRFTALTGPDKFQSNDAAEILAWLDKNVKADQFGKTMIRLTDQLRRLDQGKMDRWSRYDRAGIEAWLGEATLESGAQEMYRIDCVEDQRAEAMGKR